MSETWRERLSQRRLEIAIQGPEYYIQRYIESYCYEADRLCKEINMKKTVDEVMDSMKDKKFDSFTKGVINSIHKKEVMILIMTVKKKLRQWFQNDVAEKNWNARNL